MNETRVMTLQQLVPGSLEITVLEGKLKGFTYPLRPGRQSFGRAPENDLVLEDTSISRQHGLMDYDGKSRVVVYDLASRNGIFYKGRSQPVLTLKKGSAFQIGSIPLRLQRRNHRERKNIFPKISLLVGVVLILSLAAFASIEWGQKKSLIEAPKITMRPVTTPAPKRIPQKIQHAQPVSVEDPSAQAQEAFMKGDYAQAFVLWQKALGEDPGNFEARKGLQTLEKQAAQIYEEALMTSGTSPKKSEEMLKQAQTITAPESSIHQQVSELLALWGAA